MPRTTATPDKTMRQTEAADGFARLGETLDRAQAALEALRKDLGAGGRDLVNDVETLIESARRDTAKLARAIQADLGKLGKAVTGGPTPAPPAPRSRRPVAPATRAKAAPGTARKSPTA
jgi:hypothetical protein